MQIVQLVPGSEYDNPVRDEAYVLHEMFQSWDWQSEVYPGEDSCVLPGSIDPEAIAFYHFQITAPVDELLDHPPERTVIILHELIPAKPLDHFAPDIMARLAVVRTQLETLASGCLLAIGHSTSACDDLHNLGFKRIRRLPAVVDFEKLSKPSDRFTNSLLEDGKGKTLYAGDLYPTSGVEHLIKTIWYFNSFMTEQEFVSVCGATGGSDGVSKGEAPAPTCRPLQLFVAGRVDVCPGYFAQLSDVSGDLELGKDTLMFTGPLTPSQLRSYYQNIDVYLHLSSSDASGARLLQAIHGGVPVVALARAAAPEILGDAGVLLDDTTHSAIAEALYRLQTDLEWRSQVVERQRSRLEKYEHDAIAFQLRSLLSRFEK